MLNFYEYVSDSKNRCCNVDAVYFNMTQSNEWQWYLTDEMFNVICYHELISYPYVF